MRIGFQGFGRIVPHLYFFSKTITAPPMMRRCSAARCWWEQLWERLTALVLSQAFLLYLMSRGRKVPAQAGLSSLAAQLKRNACFCGTSNGSRVVGAVTGCEVGESEGPGPNSHGHCRDAGRQHAPPASFAFPFALCPTAFAESRRSYWNPWDHDDILCKNRDRIGATFYSAPKALRRRCLP